MKRTARLSLFERLVLAQATGAALNPHGDCWLWPGSCCNKGYGHIRVAGVTKRVHIVAWELVKGRKVRKGYTLDHECRNKPCWRPSHLKEMTRSANTAKGNRDNPRSTVAASAARRKRGIVAQSNDIERQLETVTPITPRSPGNGQD
jgi:hypothetical protein